MLFFSMKQLVVVLLFLLTSMSLFSFVSPSGVASAQSLPGLCASNSIFTIATNGGTPNSFNGVNTFTESGGLTEHIPYMSLYPPPSLNGTFYYPDSIVSGFSSNNNYTEWTFNIRPGLKWSDGSNVTPVDIVNTYSSQFALNSSADSQGLRFEIRSVVPLNSSAAQFILNKSDAHLPERVSGILYADIMPKSFISQGALFNGFGGTYPSDGPFYIVNYSSGSPQAVLRANPYYIPKPKICEIIIDYVETQAEVSTLLQSGTADLGIYVPSADIQNILRNSQFLHLFDERNTLSTDILYNMTVYPYNMTAFRQALAFGINQSQIVQQAFTGYASTAYTAEGGVPQSVAWYSHVQSTYNYSTSKALSLLASIGITKNSKGQLTYPNGSAITLDLWADSDSATDITAQTIVSQNLNLLGFNVNSIPPTLFSNLIADSYANTNGINDAMILLGSEGCDYALPYLDSLPIYQVCDPLASPPSWEYPPSAQSEYQGNLTALENTANSTLEYNYLSNIQALNSYYLPVIKTDFPSEPIIYSTARWTNWPLTNILDGYAIELNNTALALLQPVSSTINSISSSSAGASTIVTSSSSNTNSLTSASSATTSLATTFVTSSSSSSSSLSTINTAAVIMVVMITVAAAAVFSLRKRQL